MAQWVNEDTPINVVVQKKGNRARHRIEQMTEEKICRGNCLREDLRCIGTSLTLSVAMKLKGKSHLTVTLVTQLNAMPDLQKKRRN